MDVKSLEGKKIKDVMDDKTIVCNKEHLNDDWDDSIIGHLNDEGKVKDDLVLHDFEFVFIFSKEKLKAVFYVYDLENITINRKHGLMIVGGHETTHQYWFDDGEYYQENTR